VPWAIELERGLTLIKRHTEGVINEIAPGESDTVIVSSLYAIGRIAVTVNAIDATKGASGFVFGPLTFEV